MSNFIALESGDDVPIRYINMDYVREISLKKELLQYTKRDGKNMLAVDAWEIMIFFDDITRDIRQLTSKDSVTALEAAFAKGVFSNVLIDYVHPG